MDVLGAGRMKDPTPTQLAELIDSISGTERSFSLMRQGASRRPLAASEQIADLMSEDIATEAISPGAPLREHALAERYGVSRGPIRDALRLLERDGLVRMVPNKGAVVSQHSLSEMQHIADISWPITNMYLAKLFATTDDDLQGRIVAALHRIGASLASETAVEFAVGVASLTMIQARFVIGYPGERILQMLYRPSIRYTITGLRHDNGASVPAARQRWARFVEANEQRDSAAATKESLTMLRDIHLPVLQ